MSDSTHEELDRHAQQARERLMATLDVLDHRARNLVQTATSTTRATALGLAGAMALSIGLVVVQRASRRLTRRRHNYDPDRPSLLADAFKVGAVAIMFVGVSAWAKRATHGHARGMTVPPQLGHDASLPSNHGESNEAATQEQPGTTHALDRPETTLATRGD